MQTNQTAPMERTISNEMEKGHIPFVRVETHRECSSDELRFVLPVENTGTMLVRSSINSYSFALICAANELSEKSDRFFSRFLLTIMCVCGGELCTMCTSVVIVVVTISNIF